MEESKIKIKAVCLLIHNQKVLVMDADSLTSPGSRVVPGHFYRVLGGTMNFQETAEQCVRREIREEINSEIENLERLDVVENSFTYAGKDEHEILFVFKGTLSRKELVEQDTIHVVDSDYEFNAVWVPINELLNGKKPLYPSLDYSRFIS